MGSSEEFFRPLDLWSSLSDSSIEDQRPYNQHDRGGSTVHCRIWGEKKKLVSTGLKALQSSAWCREIGSLGSMDAPESHAFVTSENQFHCSRLYLVDWLIIHLKLHKVGTKVEIPVISCKKQRNSIIRKSKAHTGERQENVMTFPAWLFVKKSFWQSVFLTKSWAWNDYTLLFIVVAGLLGLIKIDNPGLKPLYRIHEKLALEHLFSLLPALISSTSGYLLRKHSYPVPFTKNLPLSIVVCPEQSFFGTHSPLMLNHLSL